VRYARTRIDLQGNTRGNVLNPTNGVDDRLGMHYNMVYAGLV
jgi:hypothetical protein